MTINIAFDFRTDTPPGCDPDIRSPTLRRYHCLLWSKRLPGGETFGLAERGYYLYHHSELGEFTLSSDAVMPCFLRYPAALQPIREQDPPQVHHDFAKLGYTIGGMMIWPAIRIDGKWTINQARGCLKNIADRFDLTLESIRRHYLDQWSPLAPTLSRYADYFALFRDYRGFVDFFLLDDLVADDGSVKFFMPFDNFGPPGSAIPKDLDTYREFRRRSTEFIQARNHRIGVWAASHLRPGATGGSATDDLLMPGLADDLSRVGIDDVAADSVLDVLDAVARDRAGSE
jgi:Family of unknown function (DUF6994)